MKDKLEERYIRTYDGFIRKIKVVSKENAPLVLCMINNKPYTVNDIKKASHNIIDLIEVGDYVNGYYVEDVLKTFVNVAVGSNYFQSPTIYEKDIKSIVTKEQMEQMAYKVG